MSGPRPRTREPGANPKGTQEPVPGERIPTSCSHREPRFGMATGLPERQPFTPEAEGVGEGCRPLQKARCRWPRWPLSPWVAAEPQGRLSLHGPGSIPGAVAQLLLAYAGLEPWPRALRRDVPAPGVTRELPALCGSRGHPEAEGLRVLSPSGCPWQGVFPSLRTLPAQCTCAGRASPPLTHPHLAAKPAARRSRAAPQAAKPQPHGEP